ncbi:MAG: AraC family transcriptional regulator [Verrucomicrobia bacterium]|nr:AraC family transcriptional regulator [Verrucomicrobiota bacterium]
MSTELFPAILIAEEETRRDKGYFYENDKRGDAGAIVIQRTSGGQGFFRDAKGLIHAVPVDHAMVFSHQEPTAYGYPPEATEPYVLRYVTVAIRSLAPLVQSLRQEHGSVLRMPGHTGATALFDELFERFNQRTFADRFHEAELVHRLIIELYRAQVQDIKETDPVGFGYDYLRSHFRSPINLKQLADRCGISREHFIRQFTKRYGESPGAVLRGLRLTQAEILLNATDADVESVALANGYASANTFRRAYRQIYGRSPRALHKH